MYVQAGKLETRNETSEIELNPILINFLIIIDLVEWKRFFNFFPLPQKY